MNELLERFCRYVRVETTASEKSQTYPSSEGQLKLAGVLKGELEQLRLDDVVMSEHGIVTATLRGNVPGAPTIALIAHMDTSPEASGKDVKPIVHANYDGRDIILPCDTTKVIRVDDTDGLSELVGKTLITTDGTTLLGADDKAGVATIMQAATFLTAHPEIRHGPIRIVFTCDEEIGHGTDKLDLDAIGAVVGYTLDGEGQGLIEAETFSADLAIVKVQGRNTHPGLATGKMINAIRLAGMFLSRLPQDRLSPETTSGKEGFVHPYVVEGGVESVTLRVLLRSFVDSELEAQADLLREAAASVVSEYPRACIDIEIGRQYRNMAQYLDKEPRAVRLAADAMRKVGVAPEFRAIRGGTDGSRLSEMGLPTPNLSTGMHNFHSPLEYACLEEMETAVRIIVELAQLWGEQGQA